MEELLTQLMGKRIALSCGTSNIIRGEVVSVSGGVLYLRDKDEKVAYVALEKIAIVWEVNDNDNRAGFLG